MTVIEALVIHTTGWINESSKDQYEEAWQVILAARREINRKTIVTQTIQWTPDEKQERTR